MGRHRTLVAAQRLARGALVSIIIPTWNRPHLLRGRSIPSVLRQTHTNWELIVVFDGSGEAVREASFVDDPRIRYLWIPRPEYPPGLDGWHIAGSWAVNHGLDHAKGQFTCVLGDDDEYLPSYIEKMLAGMAAQQVDVIYSASEVIGPQGRVGYLGRWYPPQFARQSGGEFFWRRNGIRLDPECWRKGLPNDWDFHSRMIASGLRVGHVNEPLYRYYPTTHIPPCSPY